MATEKVNVLITGDDQASPEIRKAQKSVQDLDGEYKKLSKSVGSSFSNIDKTLKNASTKAVDFGKSMTLGVTAPILALGGYAVKLASDMEETLNKVDVSFGKSSDEVKKWAETSINSMGLAQETALNSAALFGDMATGMGIGRERASEMSTELVQLSADMASFKNVSQSVTETALKSVFTGETESLKNLGIVMTQSNLERFALSQGIQKNIKDMSDEEKIALRLNFVMEATKNSHGDFARTLGGTANQTRVFSENMKELGRLFGEVIMPVFNNLITTVNKMLVNWQSMSEGTKKLIIGLAGVLAAIGPLSLAVGYLTKGYLLLKKAGMAYTVVSGLMAKASTFLTGTLLTASTGAGVATAATTALSTALKIALGPIGWVIAAVGLLFVAYKKNFLGMQDVVKAFGTASRGFMKADMEGKAQIVAVGVKGLLKIWFAFQQDLLANMVVAVKKIGGLLMKGLEVWSGVGDKLVSYMVDRFNSLKEWLSNFSLMDTMENIGNGIMDGLWKVGEKMGAAAYRIGQAFKNALKGDFSGFDLSDLLFNEDGGSKVAEMMNNIGSSELAADLEKMTKDIATGIDSALGADEFGFTNTNNAVKEFGESIDAVMPKLEAMQAVQDSTGGVAGVTDPEVLAEQVAQNTEVQDTYFNDLATNTTKAVTDNTNMVKSHGANAVVQTTDMTKTSVAHGKMVTAIKEANNNLVDNIQKTVDKAVALYQKLRQTILQIKAITAPKEGPDKRSIQDVARQFSITDPTQGSFVSSASNVAPSQARGRNFRDSANRLSGSSPSGNQVVNNLNFEISGTFNDETQAKQIMDNIANIIKNGGQFA